MRRISCKIDNYRFVQSIPWNNTETIFKQTPWYIILLVLFSYNVAATSFCLLIASFFKNSSLALRIVTLLWIITYLPYFVIYNNREKIDAIVTYLSCAFPNTVLALICQSLIERETFYDKQWSDQGYALSYVGERIRVYQGIYIFLITTVIYAAISIYMDVWHTGETGGRRRKHTAAPTHSGDFTYQDRDDSFLPQGPQPVGVKATKIYEVEPSHRRFKIKIKKLCKRYTSTSRGALNSFTWNVYENEVTVLMGHNGCGKTTLLKILAGLIEPTRGVVMISDYNIQTERHDASMQLGLALNEDLLSPDLTVNDQIRFICMVKGISWRDSNEEIDLYTQLLQLTNVRHTKIKNLTSKERSLLIICCAFAGGSPIILIDDIHSDLDLVTQTLVCNLINEEKFKRTILLVSNSTALASHLADRLAIMSNGELKCTGSKPFLRNMYGHGFRLTFIKGKAFDLGELQNLLSKYLPNLTVESDIGNKITYVLETKYEDRFPNLFDDLEEEMLNLDIISFRIRDTSLDEIFFRFGSEDGDVSGEPAVLIEDLKLVFEDSDNFGRAKGNKLIRMRMQALFKMRLILYKRHIAIKIMHGLVILIASLCTFAPLLLFGKNYQLMPISFNLTQIRYIDAFVETMSGSLDVVEMQECFIELLFWYDGHVKILKTADISDFYLLLQTDFLRSVNYHYIFGASFDTDKITVWYNNIPLHAAPYGVNLVHNVIARRFFNEEASIDVTLQPLPFRADVNALPQMSLSLGMMMVINFSFIFSNVWMDIIISHIMDHHFRKQQALTGMSLSIYCFCMCVFDFIRVIILTLLIVMVVSIYLNPRHDVQLYIWIFLANSFNGFSVITLSYLFAVLPIDPNNAFIAVSIVNVLGIIMFIITVGDNLADINGFLKPLPQYTFAEVMFKLVRLYEFSGLCKNPTISFLSAMIENCNILPNCCSSYSYWSNEYGIVVDSIMMLLAVFVPVGILLLVEYYSLMKCKCKRIPLQKKQKAKLQSQQSQLDRHPDYFVDESVLAERNLIEKLDDKERSKYAAVCEGIGKSIGKKMIIIRFDLSIAHAECVGLMGYNNSGKTTIVKMIVGDSQPSYGRMWIGGYSTQNKRSKCNPLLGYCSQKGTLPKDFTPCELLILQSKLHGLPKKFAIPICDGLSHLLGFQSCYRQLINICTTGQIRRIGFALALLGDPMLICVDGPPGGIDPNGKRTLFSLTAYMQNRGCSFLYSNLSALDCERLCERSPILYNGQVWTMGAQTERYRRGYELEVRFKRKANADISTARSTWDRINKFPVSPHNKLILFVQMKFPEAILQLQQDYCMIYYIPRNSISFAEIFQIIRKDAFELNIEDFFITRNIVGGMQAQLFDNTILKDLR
ncbi:ATP-binding cassette sub-family A member 3 isoform X2 [Drosophila hydei]|uniref:ATP-binding cassette sub-family A member 3 isoform X2 n=1 Tax=Drosophila hydei TaxID=7224 RepID=A0A6J1LSJ3_DROHY|nr:ATP-binding cassette sub-family A member 3 isoform X2 [Drosophila hydei]